MRRWAIKVDDVLLVVFVLWTCSSTLFMRSFSFHISLFWNIFLSSTRNTGEWQCWAMYWREWSIGLNHLLYILQNAPANEQVWRYYRMDLNFDGWTSKNRWISWDHSTWSRLQSSSRLRFNLAKESFKMQVYSTFLCQVVTILNWPAVNRLKVGFNCPVQDQET